MKNQPKPLPKIVPPAEIPLAEDAPVGNLLDLFRVCTQLEKICTDKDGIGLSAVQVGIPWKLFVYLHGDRYRYFVNCEYEGVGRRKKSIEGCLSLYNEAGELRRFEIDRYESVAVRGKELLVSEGGLRLEDVNLAARGLHSIVFQHEIDHQHGVMIDAIGMEVELY